MKVSILAFSASLLIVGCSKPPLTEEQAMLQCLKLALEQERELNCHHCDRCIADLYEGSVSLEETQAGKVVRTWPIQ